MKNKEQLYSQDGTNYGTYEDLMRELPDLYYKGESVEVWEADKKEWRHIDFIDVDDLIYKMQCFAHDEAGSEATENYLDDVDGEMAENLKDHIADWFNENAKLDFYGVENELKIVVIVE